jgi:hypothetical protein
VSGPVHIPDRIIEAAVDTWFEDEGEWRHYAPNDDYTEEWHNKWVAKQRALMREVIEDAFESICLANAARWERDR